MLQPMDGSSPPRQIVKGLALNAVFSPDGRWIAYQGAETGRLEIFVRAFPDLETGRWQVSSAGGRYPVWSPDGLEKNPRLRLRDIGDARFELTADATEAEPASAAPPHEVVSAEEPVPK